MAWTIEYSQTAKRGLRKLDKTVARRIMRRMDERVASDDPPRDCVPLKTQTGKLCRYRIGGYRVICEIRYPTRNIRVAEIGGRGNVYQNL